jgi:phosphatidylinositol 4-kinase A
VRLTWQLNPAITVYLPERFMLPVVHNEVTRCIRSNTTALLDVPDALRFLVGERLDANVRRDLKVKQYPNTFIQIVNE